MDLQGNPIPPGHRSTKVTQDPEALGYPKKETSGPVANDSLAAESARSGGGYYQNRNAEPLGVSGDQSTFNNTDTSGASKLSSAPDAAAREDLDRQEKYPEAMGGQGNFPGAHVPETGYTGGSTAAKQNMGINKGVYSTSQQTSRPQTRSQTQSQSETQPQSQPQSQPAEASGSGYRSQYNGGQAPSYVQSVTGQYTHTKPKGNNLTEGGFDSDPNNNASFTSDIGSDQDPGRFAENYSQRKTAETGAADAARGPTEKGIDNKTWYQPLESDQRA
ncbi:uncharacterized protein CDV56_102766 [Aspergillus thermomutatus]|uniref:Uncharacterized protein n=1 Tax=Aspergillus thermomutatus TaxID=41047 RepID=A0A397GTU8_ASPTH|nr:uncharacterized protein CDV56_102766 [Aspergillus thermomutatus]RHZ54451.1 hypothetical protein CDV56_102766 [Aspergillus thermomutatus]